VANEIHKKRKPQKTTNGDGKKGGNINRKKGTYEGGNPGQKMGWGAGGKKQT